MYSTHREAKLTPILFLMAIAIAIGTAPASWAADGACQDPCTGGGGEGGGGGGGESSSGGTYYETVLGGGSAAGYATAEPGFPETLYIEDAAATVAYNLLSETGSEALWEARITGYQRAHETVDAVYDQILVLPLPEDGAGGDGFEAEGRGIPLQEGSEEQSVVFVYGGQKVVLKRNFALEKSLLPGLVSSSSEEGKLSSLDGSGYRYTLWDTIVVHDADYGHVLQGWASLRYSTDLETEAPDAEDPRLAAYWITWIPSLPAEVAPYTVRFDVVDAGQ